MAAMEQPSLPEGIARRIRFVREYMKGWTQARLSKETAAAGLAVPLWTLKRIEAEERRPTLEELWVMAKVMNVKIRDLGATEEDYPGLFMIRDREWLKHTDA